ncbi:gamma-glutamyl-gamma-aminobutyrate hydrolase family protein [Asticcacaulis sp. AC402]|uniref:gamma-glutamyl-gamma-aminobutyrate hydrolase family protein n=1 Tax=Asticcacaulis sp. AC402 TaxID=1282361 RepID=UPI0003C3E502|nr:gamma-glutamyl-gamma-aminobutyrate hydrolase family protein [Asticcacaulis sp. AC402]ESQ76616.1 gamma-glutamyl-gamma-aminobutyrate hydrolase [Asticcacaulis sp. AC402]
MTDKPVIGIMACNRMVGVENAHAVMERYVRAATDYGNCHALLIPPIGQGGARGLTRRLDGLMLTGSPSNLQPHLYGSDSCAGPFDTGRDAVSLAMIECMITIGKPVFGICRGFQEINVVLGGTLRTDVGYGGNDMIAHHAPDEVSFDGMFDHGHEVSLTSGGVLRAVFGADRIRVNSVHYQGIDKLGDGLSVEARSDDKLVEAFSANIGGCQVLAVQWHPEWQVERYPQSQTFFRLMGKALRGESIAMPAEVHA